MAIHTDRAGREELAGRLLCYSDARDVGVAAELTAAHPASGLVVKGKTAVATVARLRAAFPEQPLVLDFADWSTTVATESSPMRCPDGGGFFGFDVDHWLAGIVDRGASVVLTPSRFVQLADWAALGAILRVGRAIGAPQVWTLVATDAAMLDRRHLATFLNIVSDEVGERALAFVFADKSEPLVDRKRERIAGLRALLARFPGSLVIATDVLAGTDVIAHGGSAAVGLNEGQRRPRRPGDECHPPAKGWIPGLFLRKLWETRSPSVYADWFANSPSPTCVDCGGRALDRFSDHPKDKQLVLRHNVHAWLAVHSELSRRRPAAARDWLIGERNRALDEHAALQPVPATLRADGLLRALCELDDPQQRRTSPTGRWR